jgi:predicted nucleic acid-binding Zn ribbon protein
MNEQARPQKIGEILRDFLVAKGLSGPLKHLEIYSVWEEVVGPAVLRHTRIAGFAHHKLYVDVDSAAHMHELRTFYKQQILTDLRQRIPAILIEDIVFRPGSDARS